MKKIKLIDIAHGRSGDKGDAANVGIIAYDDIGYEIIKKHLTIEKVKKHFEDMEKLNTAPLGLSEKLNAMNSRI